ncbi:metallophosphoesterase family protein [Burkholderia sp. Ac-20365]|uniref:metallophosphoesterase family protein n=1 Tax=Burkholderia sp. Ac-20365 TaxID=2703897 RepID=UPI00197B8A0C|nr:metallophosphoesterase family protein [Burkholderia sp. Ac-20365]MBN3763618.1 metallophosphoesterase family protein [Burkholderia sp. Ac-20365]
MKIAALSDIHGNLAALDAVLDDVRQQGADVIVNLGDILSGALYPSETADRLIPLALPTIRGNHERQLLAEDTARMGLSDRFAHRALRADQLAWIRALPTTLRLDHDVLLVHGTPESDLDYFLETVTANGCRPATQDEVESRAGAADASLILCGHTHLQRSMQLPDGRLIVNPGSVGLQAYADDRPFPHRMEMRSPHARYANVTRTASGWNVEFRSVEYEWNKAADVAALNGRSDWDIALRSGYC